MSDAEAVARLKAAMWKRKFVLMVRNVIDGSKIPAQQLAHYQWIIAQEKAGKVFLSGPVFDADGKPLGGMTVLATEDMAAAAVLAATDPFISSGAMGFELRIWQINEGRISLSVDLSDMAGAVP
jgi:uncharacterized protein